MVSVRIMFMTPDEALFERVQGFLYGRREVRLFPKRIDEFRPLLAVRREQPDVLLIDGFSSGDLGINIVRRVAASDFGTRTLLVHPSVTEARIAHVLQCGGAGCLARESNASDFIRAVQAVHAGELWASRKVLARALRQASDERVKADATHERTPPPVLSPRESEIFVAMRTGMSNKQIARELGISDMTVKTHAQNIFNKLGISGRVRLMAVAA